jgi:hypothetical protein
MDQSARVGQRQLKSICGVSLSVSTSPLSDT